MANERITENFFRKFAHQDPLYKDSKIIIEEQSSKDIKVDKLLKNASKCGAGKGYPEFVIQFKENPDFIIVVECKANIKFHESKNKDKYKDYAVDGALLYSSFLSKEFDVLSIAISGEEKNNLKISHFLQLKGTEQCHKIFNEDSFLSLSDYLNGYQKNDRKFNQDFQELLRYAKTLNENFHILKIPESNRSLLISGALIALSDKAFCKSYKYQKPKELAENLINTIKNRLTNVQNKHIEDIITSYSFIKTHTILSKKENKLREIITNVDEKINNFIKTYKYFDTLGQFYIEFLRYANNDKGLGIVLTPPHITELFSEIANVNKESIVLDTCTGTGGFLISAMKKMLVDASGNNEKELHIKSKQIIGVELQHNIFSLLCSNMYIHGDGRSNLIKGDCFDDDVINEIKTFKPNVGLLNPPYKSSKNDIEEFQFVLNNINFLEKGSLCIAIIPMSCAIATTGIRFELKKKLLKNNTLEAVFSMPNELFKNSRVGVHTCVMIFKAKEKHPENYKTYFGYWKDDGFIFRRAGGRGDYLNKWSKIKKDWITNYRNKEEIIGHSIKKHISAKKEWCVEAYMKINYTDLNSIDFQKSIKEYVAYAFNNNLVDDINKIPLINKKYTLNIDTWGEFRIGDYFDIFTGGDKPKFDDETATLVNSIENQTTNNGVKEKIKYKGNKIFCDFISMVSIGEGGHSFYHNENGAIFTRVKALCPKFQINRYIGLFLVPILNLEKSRYSYGRVLDADRIKDTLIKLPIDKNGKPDWKFMEQYIKSLNYSKAL